MRQVKHREAEKCAKLWSAWVLVELRLQSQKLVSRACAFNHTSSQGLENATMKTETRQWELKGECMESRIIYLYPKHCKWVLRALSLLGECEEDVGWGSGRERRWAAVLHLCSKWYNFPFPKWVACVGTYEKRIEFCKWVYIILHSAESPTASQQKQHSAKSEPS